MDRIGDKIQCNPAVKLEKDTLYPLIDMEKIKVGEKFVSEYELSPYTGQSCSKFCDGDTIMARITPCLENGKIAQYKSEDKKAFGSTELFVFREIPDVSDNDYIYYLLSTDFMRNNAANSMTGASGRQRADIKFISRTKWDFPDIKTQRKIGTILSAYDDLIEKNNRKIAILQEQAQELYKEWFLRFRFPGHETAKFENGLPEGWQVKHLADYGRVETGKTPSMNNPENYGDEIMFIKTPDMHGNVFVINTEEMLSQQGHETQPKKLLPPGSIMVTCIGTGGVVAINAKQGHTNQQINSIVLHNTAHLEWLYYTCRSLKETIELFGATGATMTNLSKGKFEKLKVLDPGKHLIECYHKKCAASFTAIMQLMYQNENLTHQRDLLLPRLMSGKLGVH